MSGRSAGDVSLPFPVWTDADRADRCGEYDGYAGWGPDRYFRKLHRGAEVRRAYVRAYLRGMRLRKRCA